MSQVGIETNRSIRNKQRVNYIYSFTQYITWSNLENKKSFKIGVYGKDQQALINELKKVAIVKKIKKLPVEVVRITNSSEIKELEILYIHEKSKVELETIIPKLALKEVLLVSENYPFRKSMINFMEFENELHFDVNKIQINNAGLLVSPQLLKFSIQQQKDWEEIFERLEEEQNKIEVQLNELENLNAEIERQKSRMDAQRTQIKKQQRNLIKQEGDIEEKQRELEGKLNEIDRQKVELSNLQKLINRQNDQAFRLKHTLDRQKDSVEVRKHQLLVQRRTMLDQEGLILKQVREISNQDKTLNTQIQELRSQGLLIYVFLVIIIIILALIFFAWREYKRKRKGRNLITAF